MRQTNEQNFDDSEERHLNDDESSRSFGRTRPFVPNRLVDFRPPRLDRSRPIDYLRNSNASRSSSCTNSPCHMMTRRLVAISTKQ